MRLHHLSMDELVAAWVKATTAEQGKDEKPSDSDTIARLRLLIRARKLAGGRDRTSTPATDETQDFQAEPQSAPPGA